MTTKLHRDEATRSSPSSFSSPAENGRHPLLAYPLSGIPAKLVPATPDRPWMNAFNTSFANRCLPMRIANQDGWFVLNPSPISLVWNGGARQEDITIEVLDGTQTPALSHFGHGILTWWVPYMFRTPPGYNMYVRGPVNFCKDGICALHAIVETDWAVASFPISWKITRPGLPIRFERDEPICMVSPVRRGETESFDPEIQPIQTDPYAESGHATWSESRRQHNESLRHPNPPKKWEKHYFIGTHPGTEDKFPDHQVRLAIRPFVETSQAAQTIAAHAARMKPVATLEPKEAIRSCPFPAHATAVSCPVPHTPASPNRVLDKDISQEPHFFALFHQMEELMAAWASPNPGKEITLPRWDCEYARQRHSLLSCDPASVFPADVMAAIRRRLDVWSAASGHGALRSLQLSLLTSGAFRHPGRTRDEVYFALPLRRKAATARGGRLYTPDAKARDGWIAGLLGKPAYVEAEPNCLVAFAPELQVGIEEVHDSPDPADSLLLLEGTVASTATA